MHAARINKRICNHLSRIWSSVCDRLAIWLPQFAASTVEIVAQCAQEAQKQLQVGGSGSVRVAVLEPVAKATYATLIDLAYGAKERRQQRERETARDREGEQATLHHLLSGKRTNFVNVANQRGRLGQVAQKAICKLT